MQEEIDIYFDSSIESMDGALSHLKKELNKIRTGKASPVMLETLTVDYYGSASPLGQVSNISVADARTLTIKPWEKKMLQVIERALFEANLGITPMNDGEMIRMTFPPLTEERRRDLVKQVKSSGEDAKVSVRNIRRDLMEAIKKAVKDGYPEDMGKKSEEEAQKLTNDYNTKIDTLIEIKEKEIMTV